MNANELAPDALKRRLPKAMRGFYKARDLSVDACKCLINEGMRDTRGEAMMERRLCPKCRKRRAERHVKAS